MTIVQDLMKGSILHADVKENLKEIIRLLYQYNADAVIVRENGVPKGIITANEIVKCFATTNKAIEKISAREAMNSPIISVNYNSDPDSAKQIMLKHGLTNVPVKMDYDIIGLLTSSDLF